MTNKLTPGEALQKILDALGVDDLNLNSRGLFEDYIRQAAPLVKEQNNDK